MDAFQQELRDIPQTRDAAALRVKSADFSWFSPIIFPREDTLGAIQRVHAKLGDEAYLHLEYKRFNGYMTAEGVPLFKYQGFDQMTRLYKAFEAEGVRIANAHTFLLQNGGMKDVDAAQIAFTRSVDPHLLMNPGKIAGLVDLPGGLSGAALEAAQLPASGWAY